jgi:ubiquinone/menaquinone biosynthesis C-methylase UbiE
MESLKRKPFQGITNIIRFNWHFYLAAVIIISLLVFINSYTNYPVHLFIVFILICIVGFIVVSLLASYIIYDLSSLYKFSWLKGIHIPDRGTILNINAGFDETSAFLTQRFPSAELLVYDFYDPSKHTEVSIKRARKAYPSYQGTISISTNDIPCNKNSVDHIFMIMSLHEIRNRDERIGFLKQLKNKLKPGGRVTIVEHLRDISNFLVYNIGFFHFYSKTEWMNNFSLAGLLVEKEIKITPFISCYTLKLNEDAYSA